MADPPRTFFLATLGCPKNAVDSDKVTAALLRDGLEPAGSAGSADLVVVNTCAFIEAAREESIETILALAGERRPGARLVVTGCLAERYGDELAQALPEVDAVIGFGGQPHLAETVLGAGGIPRKPVGVRDLLDLPRARPSAPWAYLKVAEGCDRTCAFCAIPSFRGPQASRTPEAIEAEARQLVADGVAELVLVAQDPASYGRDLGMPRALASLLARLDTLSKEGLLRQRVLYLYPSEVRAPLVPAMLELPTVVPYFDLSLQHASASLLRQMRRWGSAERFLAMIDSIRAQAPDAAFRSSFIVGFPGETEDDHEALLGFLEAAELDWAGFFAYSPEDGTPAATRQGAPPPEVVRERMAELGEVQERVTAWRRHALLEREIEVLVDAVDEEPGATGRGVVIGRTHREAPEIDGVVRLADAWARPGAVVPARVTGVDGPDLEAEPLEAPVAAGRG